MWPIFVVLAPERIEVPLLRRAGLAHGFDRLSLERAMHPLMHAVLLRRRRPDALMCDAELHPVGVEERKTVDCGGGEGHAVVGADRARQAILAKRPLEDRPREFAFGGAQSRTREQEARGEIGHEQVGQGRRERVRAGVGRAAPVGEPTPPLLGIASNSCVAGGATHPFQAQTSAMVKESFKASCTNFRRSFMASVSLQGIATSRKGVSPCSVEDV